MAQSTKNEQARSGGAETQGKENLARSGARSGEGMQRSRSQEGGQWPMFGAGPFELMRRMSHDMDRLFERAFGDIAPAWSPWRSGGRVSGREEGWAPQIDAFRKEDKFVVRAELPGVKKENVHVEVADDELTIHGERKEEREDEREGYYMRERSYGSFYRTIPLPEGAIAENADASFKDGVLEVTMPCPPHEVSRGRRLEIKEGS